VQGETSIPWTVAVGRRDRSGQATERAPVRAARRRQGWRDEERIEMRDDLAPGPLTHAFAVLSLEVRADPGRCSSQQFSRLVRARLQVGETRLCIGEQPQRALVSRHELLQWRGTVRELADRPLELREQTVQPG